MVPCGHNVDCNKSPVLNMNSSTDWSDCKFSATAGTSFMLETEETPTTVQTRTLVINIQIIQINKDPEKHQLTELTLNFGGCQITLVIKLLW